MANNRQQTNEYYLFDTGIENMFINEYLPVAPGEYVKVYIFALMYADLGTEMTNAQIAKQLSMSEDEVMKAWTYWESMGVVKKNYSEDGSFGVTFLNLKAKLYGKAEEKPVAVKSMSVEGDELTDKEIEKMFESIEKITGNTLSGAEVQKVIKWIKELNATPGLITYAYAHSRELGKTSIQYVGAVVNNWVAKGLTDEESIRAYIDETDQRHYLYRRVMKALGFTRNATEAECEMMDAWFDDLGYTIDKVLEACGKTSAISNPNMKYVDTVLRNWKEEPKQEEEQDSVSLSTVMRYYEYIQKEVLEAAQRHKREVFEKVPRIKEIEEELTSLSKETSRMVLMTGKKRNEKISEQKERIGNLVREKTKLMTDNGFEINYMEPRHMCEICKDTGISDTGERCSCFADRAQEARLWQKNLK